VDGKTWPHGFHSDTFPHGAVSPRSRHLTPDKSDYRTSGLGGLRSRFNSDLVVDRLSQSLLAAEVFLSSLHRDVAQQKLNLFQFASGAMAETSARPS
jgi:hypothetical protein